MTKKQYQRYSSEFRIIQSGTSIPGPNTIRNIYSGPYRVAADVLVCCPLSRLLRACRSGATPGNPT
jgi:hypothetical protein